MILVNKFIYLQCFCYNMFKDPLQERLKQMEQENPSVNPHPKSSLDFMADQLYFIGRFLSFSVKEYTDEQRFENALRAMRNAAEHARLWRAGSPLFWHNPDSSFACWARSNYISPADEYIRL